MNMGQWFIYDPVSKRGGPAPFYPGSKVRNRNIIDGLSKTLCAAEVRAWTSYQRDGKQGDPPLPDSPDDIPSAGDKKWGPQVENNTGHTEWVDGRVHQSGFTTTFTPNTWVTPAHAEGYDIDWTNSREGKDPTEKTYAAVTSRSYHAGDVVTVVFMDGSARTITGDVDLVVWRAASTRDGAEPHDDFD